MDDAEKICETCGRLFSRKPKDSATQWANRAFCSLRCSGVVKRVLPTHLYFWKYAERRGDDDCWPWQGTVDQHGYGRVRYMVSTFKAHRVSYEMFFGPIPDDLVVRHKCDNPNCVNPRHLTPGTQKQNMQDASRRGRLNAKSLLNLRPGSKGIRGAGPISNKELRDVR